MKRKLTAAFLLMLFLLVGTEVVIRVFFARNMAGRFDYGYHPDAGFVEEDGKLKLVRAGGRRFFPQEMSLQRDPGTFRIFVIGDSVPRGPGQDKAYAHQLQEVLRAQGQKVEAFNLCVAGYGSQRKHIVLTKALEYQPSLVILHLNGSNEYEDEREYKRSREFDGWHPKNWLMKSLLVRRLYEAKTEKAYWHLLPTEVRQQNAVSDADAEVAAGMDEATLKRWDEQVARWTATSVQAAKAKNTPILLVAQAVADMKAGKDKPLEDRGLDAIADTQKGPGVEVLSIRQTFQDHDYPALYSDGSHMRAEGHKLLAEALARQLVTAGLLPRTGKTD